MVVWKSRNIAEDARSVTVHADATGVAGALRHAFAFADGAELGGRDRYRLGIVAEELVRNVMLHGAVAAATAEAEVELTIGSVEDGIEVRMTDRGIAFDPRHTSNALPWESDELPDDEGGVGWPLIHLWCRIDDYAREDGVNHLRLTLLRDEDA